MCLRVAPRCGERDVTLLHTYGRKDVVAPADAIIAMLETSVKHLFEGCLQAEGDVRGVAGPRGATSTDSSAGISDQAPTSIDTTALHSKQSAALDA